MTSLFIKVKRTRIKNYKTLVLENMQGTCTYTIKINKNTCRVVTWNKNCTKL